MKSMSLFLVLVLPLAAQEVYQIAAEPVKEGQILIDGQFTEAAWEKAIPVENFTGVMGAVQINKTSARFLYDEKGLFIGFTAEVPANFQIKEGIGMFAGERIEFILKPFPDEMTYFLFTVNANGDRDEGCFGSPDYSEALAFQGQWQSQVRVKKGSWQAEVFIPYSTLETEAPSSQKTVWKTNICRGEGLPNGDRYSAWNPKFSGFHYAGCTIVFNQKLEQEAK